MSDDEVVPPPKAEKPKAEEQPVATEPVKAADGDTGSGTEDALLAVPEFSKAPEGARLDINSLPTASFKKEPWNKEEHDAKTQARLAFRLLWVLVLLILIGAGALVTVKWTGLQTKDVETFFGVAFSAVVTLTTAATSFWFGSQRGQSQRPPSESLND